MFECYNLMLQYFEVNLQQGKFKILRLLSEGLILLFFEKLIFPTMSKTIEFSQKTQGILGVKLPMLWLVDLLAKK